MATLSSLLVKIQVDEVNKQFIFTDLIGSDYNVVYGYSDVLGLIKISGSQTGVVYKNPGWDATDYSHPDISTSFEKIIPSVPLDSDDLVVNQFYTVEYKISVDAGSTTYLSFLEVFNFNYKPATLDLRTALSFIDMTLTFTDSTVYTLKLGGNDYSPTSLTRNIEVTWPADSNIPNTVSNLQEVTLGPDLWSGIYSATLTTDLKYVLSNVNGLMVTVTDTLTQDLERIIVPYQDFTGMVNLALEQLTTKYEDLKEYNLPYAQNYQELLDDIMMYYDMFKMAADNAQDLSYSMEKIYELLQSDLLDLDLTLEVALINPNENIGGAILTTDSVPEGTVYDRLYVSTPQRTVLKILEQFGFAIPEEGTLLFSGNLEAPRFITLNGTADDFVKGDGSLADYIDGGQW